GRLLTTIAPELLRQGHQRPARDLLEAADRLASTVLADAPAAEFQLRNLLAEFYLGEGPSLLDSVASYEQVRRINELVQKLPAGTVPGHTEQYRIRLAGAELWAGDPQRGLAELQALKEEFRRRTPPADHYLAWCLATEGN